MDETAEASGSHSSRFASLTREGDIFFELNFAESRVISRPKVCSNITAKFRVGPCELAFVICCICPRA